MVSRIAWASGSASTSEGGGVAGFSGAGFRPKPLPAHAVVRHGLDAPRMPLGCRCGGAREAETVVIVIVVVRVSACGPRQYWCTFSAKSKGKPYCIDAGSGFTR